MPNKKPTFTIWLIIHCYRCYQCSHIYLDFFISTAQTFSVWISRWDMIQSTPTSEPRKLHRMNELNGNTSKLNDQEEFFNFIVIAQWMKTVQLDDTQIFMQTHYCPIATKDNINCWEIGTICPVFNFWFVPMVKMTAKTITHACRAHLIYAFRFFPYWKCQWTVIVQTTTP